MEELRGNETSTISSLTCAFLVRNFKYMIAIARHEINKILWTVTNQLGLLWTAAWIGVRRNAV